MLQTCISNKKKQETDLIFMEAEILKSEAKDQSIRRRDIQVQHVQKM